MGANKSSFRGHQTTIEPSFTVRATGYYDLPIRASESSFPARANEYTTTFQVQTKSGPDYSNFPFHTSSSFGIRTNGSGFGLYNNNNSNTSPPPQGKSSGVMAFHSSSQWRAHFDAAKDSDKLMVIDFTATWCGPCRSMDAVINDFAAKYTNVEFIKIDVDELHDVAMKYEVVSMPTFLLMKRGKVVDKVVGADKDQLKTKIEHRLC